MRKGTPRRPKVSTSTLAGPDTCLKKPDWPSKMGAGPVTPARASSAAKTALRAASAAASPFQSDRVCIRVCARGIWSLMARLTAWVSCSGSSFISLPPDDRSRTGHGKRNIAADTDGPFLERSDTAADRIDDVDFDPFDGRGVEVVVAQGMGIGGQPFRERSLTRC